MVSYLDYIKEHCERRIFKESIQEISIRCPFCGDSIKNKQHVHCYVSKYSIPGYNSPMFHCMKCSTSGPVRKLLKKLGAKLSTIDMKTTSCITPVQNQLLFYKKGTTNKEEYIKRRLNLDPIPKWIDDTVIDTVVVKDKALFTNFINHNYIGFRSFDMNKINMRRIVNNDNFQRYITLKKPNSSFDAFVIFPKSKTSLIKPGTIILAEGSFTVLKGYFSLMKIGYINKFQQVLLAASWSKTSFNTCMKYLYSRFGVLDWNIILLADKDFDKNHIGKLKFSCDILYNKYHDDFGEECNNIKRITYKNDYIRRKL